VILSTAAVAAAEKDGAVLSGSRAVVGPSRDRRCGQRRHSGAGHFDDRCFQESAPRREIGLVHGSGRRRNGCDLRRRAVGSAGHHRRREEKGAFNTGREVIAAVLKGDAELGVGFTTEFVPVKGVRVVGVLPKEIEFVNEYSAYCLFFADRRLLCLWAVSLNEGPSRRTCLRTLVIVAHAATTDDP
jgi:hypothetical protein